MNFNDAIKHIAVIGAAGKMGSGISLILLQELAMSEVKLTGKVGGGLYRLDLIDIDFKALEGLREYLRTYLKRLAEKEVNTLRAAYAKNPSLVSNADIIEAFVQGSLNMANLATAIEEAKEAVLIFEAVAENLQIKKEVFSKLKKINKNPFYILTNTSSLPIHVLNNEGDLQNRIIGFHFYNPPAVQKLVELIPLSTGEPLLYEWAFELSKLLNKQIVISKDVAGFIGNGFLVREALYACAKVRELATKLSFSQSLYMVNKVTQEFLLRPMGIFQLLDYVGIDVVFEIGEIMNTYMSHGSYEDELIRGMVNSKIFGGQHSDGSQKEGFFKYENHQITAVYSLPDKRYISLNEGTWKAEADKILGEIPIQGESWKVLHRELYPEARIVKFLESLSTEKCLGACLAREFIYRDREISRAIVSDGVARNADDVKDVLHNGFYHLYGPEDAVRIEEKACIL